MATLPKATTELNESSDAFGAGTDYVVVMSCVAQNADFTPRVMSGTQDILDEYLYSPGADYAALHFAKTGLPVIFVGLPVETPGAVGSLNTSGVTGTCNVSVSAASTGIMEEVSGAVTVQTGGTVGADQIVLQLSCDGGLSQKTVRLGNGTSYAIPNLGIVLNFGAGTLNPGDVVTFQTTAPMWGSTAIASARAALAAQEQGQRSWLVVGDCPNATVAGYVVNEANNYETENDRFVYARAQIQDRLPLGVQSQIAKQMTGAPSLTFSSTAHTIVRSDDGSFLTDGFVVGDGVTVAGSASNNGFAGVLTGVSASTLTFASGLVTETVTGASVASSPVLTFAASGHTITRSSGSWLADNFEIGDTVTISGTTSNNGTVGPITALSAGVMTFGSGLVNEGPIASSSVSIEQSLTMSEWISNETANFASIDAQKRIDLAAGKAFCQSPITGWNFRRSAAWAASLREFTKPLNVATYRKSDGPLDGFKLTDAKGNTVEYDERVVGGALAGRFTCLRSWANGPKGAFVALSLTRDTDDALLSRTQNMAVACLAQSIVQAMTEDLVGSTLVLNPDGTGTSDSLSLMEKKVNKALAVNLLQSDDGADPLASNAVWSASRTDNLQTPGATLHGSLALELDGTLEDIDTAINVS